jgi:hypothetical protein
MNMYSAGISGCEPVGSFSSAASPENVMLSLAQNEQKIYDIINQANKEANDTVKNAQCKKAKTTKEQTLRDLGALENRILQMTASTRKNGLLAQVQLLRDSLANIEMPEAPLSSQIDDSNLA